MRGRLALGTLGALVLTACDHPLACGDKVVVSEDANAPIIDHVAIVSQLAEDSWTVVLGVDYEDADGDLSAGNAVFYLNDGTKDESSQALRPAFKQSAIPEGTPSGTLILPVRFDDKGINNGTKVDLGLQLVDGASLRSNCYGITIQFEVSGR